MKSAAYSFLKGEGYHWRACCLLFHDYGQRKERAYHEFQRELWEGRQRQISTSHLRFMMGAYLTYLELCKGVGAAQVVPLRRQLPYTYFARAGQRWRMQDLTAKDVLYTLRQAADGTLESAAQVQDALIAEAFVNGDATGEMNGRRWLRTGLYPGMLRFTETPPGDVPGDIVYHAQEFVRLSKAWLNGDAY